MVMDCAFARLVDVLILGQPQTVKKLELLPIEMVSKMTLPRLLRRVGWKFWSLPVGESDLCKVEESSGPDHILIVIVPKTL